MQHPAQSGPARNVEALLRRGLGESFREDASVDGPRVITAEAQDFGPFQLLNEIARGGMGIIYRARERHTSRVVAVKMIKSELTGRDDVRERFKREVRAAAALDHSNILPIYDVGEWGGTPYYSMKLAEGGSLADQGRAAPRLSSRQCAELTVKVSRAIEHAHGRGVLHRDVKPGNILLDVTGEPLVADFGLAQLALDPTAPDLTRTLVVLGSPGYIAPELALGMSSRSADIYGIGALLYYLLSGHQPFEGLDPLLALRQATASSPPSPRRWNPGVPRSVETVCLRCMQPAPADRYGSAEEIALDLERYLAGRRVRWVRRRVRVWRASLMKGALLLVGAFSLWATLNSFRSPGTGREAALDPAAEQFLSRGRDTISRQHSEPGLRSAEELIRRARMIDPNAAIIRAELSRVLSKIYWHTNQDEAVAAEALIEAEAAIRLDGSLAMSHVAMGDYLFRCRRDYAAALRSLRRAEQLDPNLGVVQALKAIVLKRLGRWEEALEANRHACRIEPNSAPSYYDLAVTCDVMRQYPEAITAIERARYLAPDNAGHTLLHAWLLFRAHGDTSGLEQIVRELPFEQQMSPQYFDTVFWWLLWSQRPDSALRLARSIPDDYAVRRYDALLQKPYFVGVAAHGCGDSAAARPAFEAARENLEARVQEAPRDARAHSQLGIVNAWLGRNEDAVARGVRAAELLSFEREPVGGSYVAAQLAEIYARVGATDKAIALIKDLLARPGHLTVHELRIDPRWDALRQHERFRRLLGG